MRLAIFGGTFDPIHNAHLAVALEAAARFALDRVWLVPAERPPHKQGVTHAPYADRFRMVELACRDEPGLEASRLEQETASSYSIDTIEKVRARLAPGDKLFFVIGADAFAEIESWRRWQDVVRAVEFIVVSRPGHRYGIPAAATVHRLETVDLPVSSSEIRGKLAAGDESVEVPPAVLDYIHEHRLYRGC
ncbi:MAG TPA: nicotinate-nucleotide adenylyltransferase [Bryobacteraceae bacterium]|nr:nicotinate-nucleotide adenylyltransferase [Bryobacteraceae bacterium]